MSDLKTKPTRASVPKFLESIDNETRRRDCAAVVEMMKAITGEPPRMWGDAIIGFGTYRYRYDTAREVEWFLTGVSPRKQSLTLYIMSGFAKHDELLGKLGKHKTGKSCLYINKLDDVHLPALERLIRQSVAHVAKRNA